MATRMMSYEKRNGLKSVQENLLESVIRITKSGDGIDLTRWTDSFEAHFVSDVAALNGLKDVRHTWKVILY